MQKKKNTLGEVLAEVRFGGVRDTDALVSAIKLDRRLRWGTPRIVPGSNNRNTVVCWAHYGPVLGGWPSDVRRKAHQLLRRIGSSGSVELGVAQRNCLASRREVEEGDRTLLSQRSLLARGRWVLL